jgi:hypothetical protein
LQAVAPAGIRRVQLVLAQAPEFKLLQLRRSSNQFEKTILLHFSPTRRGVSVQQLALCSTQR